MTAQANGKRHVALVGHHASPTLHGAERSFLDILAAIDRQAYRVSCILPNPDEDYLRAVAKFTDDIFVLPSDWRMTRPCDPDVVSRFEKIFRLMQVDLVHVNTITRIQPLIAARRLGLPSIVHARELIDRDQELAHMLGDTPASIVSTVQREADFIVANSNATRQVYGEENVSFRLYNCVDADRSDLPNRPEPGKLRVGIVSSNLPKKGIEDFVDLAILAAARHPGLEFFVIGPRTDHTECLEQSLRNESNPVKIHFTGYVADPVEAIRMVNVVVSFSIVPESFGRTIVEAMAARRPVIAYDWGAMAELVRHGQDGFLIPYRQYPVALRHLGSLLVDHPRKFLEMGENGRARARQLFSTRDFATELNEIYRRVFEVWHADMPVDDKVS